MRTKFALALSFLALFALMFPTHVASARQTSGGSAAVTMKITLVPAPGFATAKGTAKLKSVASKQEFEVEAQISRRSAGAVLGVTVGDTVVGTMTVNALGKAKLSLSTEAGQFVPAIAPGTLIGVVDSLGTPILAGQF